MSVRRPRVRRDGTMREEDLEMSIIQALRGLGFEVVHTSAKRQKGGSGVSKGVPDLLVSRRPRWNEASPLQPRPWLGMEVKSKDAKGNWKYSCVEQRDLHAAGFTCVVTTIDQAVMEACKFFGMPRAIGFAFADPEPVRDQSFGAAIPVRRFGR